MGQVFSKFPQQFFRLVPLGGKVPIKLLLLVCHQVSMSVGQQLSYQSFLNSAHDFSEILQENGGFLRVKNWQNKFFWEKSKNSSKIGLFGCCGKFDPLMCLFYPKTLRSSVLYNLTKIPCLGKIRVFLFIITYTSANYTKLKKLKL